MTDNTEWFTGKTGLEDFITKKLGEKYLVIRMYDESVKIYTDEFQKHVHDSLMGDDVAEWTYMKAFSELDAIKYSLKAHDQWYDKQNGIKDWKNSAKLGIRS